jgi:excisionase family DNA binding protein
MNQIEVDETLGPTTTAWDDLLTVDDVAAMLKVPKSWVYERTRRRGKDRLPFLKLGKYLRFETQAVRAFLAAQRKSA